MRLLLSAPFSDCSGCQYSLGAATYPAIELHLQLYERPLRLWLLNGSESRPVSVHLSGSI
jgi:hypothetical protein